MPNLVIKQFEETNNFKSTCLEHVINHVHWVLPLHPHQKTGSIFEASSPHPEQPIEGRSAPSHSHGSGVHHLFVEEKCGASRGHAIHIIIKRSPCFHPILQHTCDQPTRNIQKRWKKDEICQLQSLLPAACIILYYMVSWLGAPKRKHIQTPKPAGLPQKGTHWTGFLLAGLSSLHRAEPGGKKKNEKNTERQLLGVPFLPIRFHEQ